MGETPRKHLSRSLPEKMKMQKRGTHRNLGEKKSAEKANCWEKSSLEKESRPMENPRGFPGRDGNKREKLQHREESLYKGCGEKMTVR